MVDEADVVLEERIAEGSFGFVFKGTYKGCKVAVKLFKINFNAGQSATNMLRSLKDEMVGVLFHGVLLLITQLLTSLPLLLTPAPPHSRSSLLTSLPLLLTPAPHSSPHSRSSSLPLLLTPD
jgi:hypothetical protein